MKNKPSSRFTDKLLRAPGDYSTKQRAAQNWCLFRMLPLLIGDIIPESDPHFAFLLKFHEIMDIIFSPVLGETDPDVLEALIFEFFAMFNRLFPDVNPINKFHHLIHYPEMMRLFGPPIRYWCMRFEAFHNLIKRKAQVNCNFINLPKSVADHLQIIFCSNLMDSKMFASERLNIGPFKSVNGSDALTGVPLENSTALDVEANVTVPNWIELNGWRYQVGTHVHLKSHVDRKSGLPLFGKVTKILLQNDKSFAVVSVLRTVCFSHHFHSFQVEPYQPSKLKVVDLKKLPESEPLDGLKSFSKRENFTYICPRHLLM